MTQALNHMTVEETVKIAYLKAMQRGRKVPVLWKEFDPSKNNQIVLTKRQMDIWKQLER